VIVMPSTTAKAPGATGAWDRAGGGDAGFFPGPCAELGVALGKAAAVTKAANRMGVRRRRVGNPGVLTRHKV